MALLSNRLVFVRNLNIDSILPYLRSSNILTLSMEEQCMSEKTTAGRNGYLLDMLPRRGPNAIPCFINALIETNQHHLAILLDANVIVQPSIKIDQVFNWLKTTIQSLQPLERQSERSMRLLTSVNIYSEKAPVSNLGAREIPFLMALKSGMYGIDNILSWPIAPNKQDFERSVAIYDSEISEMEQVFKLLENGGIEFQCITLDERIIKIIQSFNNKYTTCCDQNIFICIPTITTQRLSQMDLNVIYCILHLMCFCQHSFLIRKTTPPKPNSYLLFNAKNLLYSDVVFDKDREFVRETITTDESVILHSTTVNCPW